jgi:hypothetical protein
MERSTTPAGYSDHHGPQWRLDPVCVLALAPNRLARAVTVDEITQPARERVLPWTRDHVSGEGRRRLIERPVVRSA